MRLMQVDLCSSYPMARAGGHRTVHSLLWHLSQTPDVACMSLFPRRGLGSQLPEYDPKLADLQSLGIRGLSVEPNRWTFDCGYPVWAVESAEEEFAPALDFFAPDIVWSNSFRSLPLLREARRRGLAALWYLHDSRPVAEDLREAIDLGIELIAVSHFIQDRVHRLSGGPCTTIYPLITESDYLCEPSGGGFVTFINPRPVKGYEVFLGIAPLLPDVQFLVVEAWPLGAGLAEVEEQLAALANVRFLRQISDTRDVYRQTRLLLVPSMVEEGGPRVIREAQLNGIPVIGSPRGGVPEMIGDGGIVIEDYENPAVWAAAIHATLSESGRLSHFSRAALANAFRDDLTTPTVVRQFRDACGRAIHRGGLSAAG
jgi:glycosyltransferase involved in cell wall biosynthesis